MLYNLLFLIVNGVINNMNGISERLKELRTKLNLSMREFSKQIYISHSLYGEIEIGHREITDRITQLISSRFNVSKDWILKGEGEMFTAPPPDVKLERLIEIYNILPKLLKDCLLEQSDILLRIYEDKNK
jgi:transcriptional regulator with XRE-family HTH domain